MNTNRATHHRSSHRIGVLGLLAGALLMTSCAGSRFAAISPTAANGSVEAGYRLMPGDRIRISVFDEPNLTGEFLVGKDGNVSMPLLAQVPAGNQTPAALADKVQQRLAEGGYVLSPRVAVEVLTHKPYFILGEVNNAGEFPYSGEITVLQAIAKAGGFTPRANRSRIVLRRPGWDDGRLVTLTEAAVLVRPGDTIEIREALF